MTDYNLINQYLEQLARNQPDPLLRQRILQETADHLHQAVDEELRHDSSLEPAQRRAIARFGHPSLIHYPISKPMNLLRQLLILSSFWQMLIGLFLVSVIFFILPSDNSADQIPFWSAAAIAFLLYGVLTLGYLQGWRHHIVRNLLFIASLGGLVAGAMGIMNQIRQTMAEEGDPEGYIMLMAMALIGHGLLLWLYMWLHHDQRSKVVT